MAMRLLRRLAGGIQTGRAGQPARWLAAVAKLDGYFPGFQGMIQHQCWYCMRQSGCQVSLKAAYTASSVAYAAPLGESGDRCLYHKASVQLSSRIVAVCGPAAEDVANAPAFETPKVSAGLAAAS